MATQYQIPVVGSKVRVTLRFPDNYFKATKPFIDTTYEGVVITNHKLIRPNAFTLSVPTSVNAPILEIELDEHVVDLEYLDGTVATKSEVDSGVKSITVEGSKGSVYTVTKIGNKVTCTCSGFSFRRTCRHLALIK